MTFAKCRRRPRKATLRRKCREYRARGVDVTWLVLPLRRAIEVFDDRHDGAAFEAPAILTAAELPGFELDLAELFASLD